MVFAFVVACLVGAAPLSSIWFDASDLQSGTIELAESGKYTMWVWDARDADLSLPILTIGSNESAPPKARRNDDEYLWRKLGTVVLESGEHVISISDTVARVVFTLNPEYSPETVARDLFVLDRPEASGDRRAQTARHTDTIFTFPEYTSVDEWEATADVIRRRILLSSGLWPLPEKTPLNAQVFGRVQHEDYSVEKVHYQAWPGYYVTGNLYRPVGDGPFPAVYSPHGHWEEGRLVNTDVNSIPGRSITLARMGAVVFVARF